MPRCARAPLRAAAVGGGAYMAGKSRAESKEREARAGRAPGTPRGRSRPPPPPSGPPRAAGPAGPQPQAIEQLTQLGKLHEQGVLTDEEFTQQKPRTAGRLTRPPGAGPRGCAPHRQTEACALAALGAAAGCWAE